MPDKPGVQPIPEPFVELNCPVCNKQWTGPLREAGERILDHVRRTRHSQVWVGVDMHTISEEDGQ